MVGQAREESSRDEIAGTWSGTSPCLANLNLVRRALRGLVICGTCGERRFHLAGFGFVGGRAYGIFPSKKRESYLHYKTDGLGNS